MEEKYIKLSDAKKAIEDYRSELTVSKYGSLDECMTAKFAVTGAMKELDYIPAADVVPKSEVERWRRNLEERAEEKAEVAREIFAEIEKMLSANTSGEFRGDSIEWFDYYDLHLAEDIAELKKKYTEGGGENGT